MGRYLTTAAAVGTALLLKSGIAWAVAASGLPFDQPLNTWTTGLLAVAEVVVVLGVIILGFTWAHTHHGVGVMKATSTVVGGGVAIKALDLMGLFGWSGTLF